MRMLSSTISSFLPILCPSLFYFIDFSITSSSWFKIFSQLLQDPFRPIEDFYSTNRRLFTNRSKTLCQRTRDFSPTDQRLLTKQSRISHSNNQIFFYNRYNAFINLFRILSITNYTMILTIPLYQLYHAHFSVLIKNFTQQEYFFHPFNFLRYIFLSPFWYP